MERLVKLIEAIKKPDQEIAVQAQAHLDDLTKPQGSLGRMEDLARELCIMRGAAGLSEPKPAVGVFAADHGAALAGMSPFPREVTAQMVMNFLAGGAGINVFCNQAGAKVCVVDVGVDHDFGEVEGLISAKVARGTKDMSIEPAMTREEALDAIMVGAKVANDLIDEGHDILAPGEMGIANTTASTAIACAFTGIAPADAVGRGAGLDDEGLKRKQAYLEKSLAFNKPDPADPLGVLSRVGGLELAAIAGFALAAAARRVPVMLDGIISTAGCYVAYKLAPAARCYFMAGHASVEHVQKAMLDELELKPLLDLNLRLGEGTGAALAFLLVRAAVAMYNQMATFSSAGVSNRED